MIKATLADIKKSPINYLYIFAPDTFINALGSKTAKIIRQKKANQQQLLKVAAIDNKSTYEVWRDAVYNAIQDQYAMTPAQILVALAEGKDIAGKNWNKGVYGVGAMPQYTFNQNNGVSVDPKTGKIQINYQNLSSQTPIYGNGGQIIGYAAIGKDGASYTSALSNGQYYANTYGTESTQQYANGSNFTASGSSNVWETILTYIPMISSILSWILSLFGVNTGNLITYQNTYPSQSEFTYSSGLSNNELLLLAGGAAIVYAATK